MTEVFYRLLDWSEAWATLIPLVYFLFHRNQLRYMRPVILYVILAFLINLTADGIMEYNRYMDGWRYSNNPLYNIHSLVRFACFVWFFELLGQSEFNKYRKYIPWISGVLIFYNFLFLENFWDKDKLSGNLLATEAYLLLVYCMMYYLSKLRDDGEDWTDSPDFWVVTGLAVYVVVNFFVFLFYLPMIEQDIQLALDIWNLHNIAYILLCIFITRALYVSSRNQYTN